MIKLSKRLECIARQVPAGSRLADIGSDHALLPAFLIEEGIVAFAIAGEVNPGPCDAARKQAALLGDRERERIAVRLGDGLQVIKPGEVDAITIAGMGGNLIVHILSNGLHKLTGVQTLILQPNVGEAAVRQWLVDHEWVLTDEQIIEEDGKIYEILTARRDPDASRSNEALYAALTLACGLTLHTDQLLLMGPYLLRGGAPELVRKWRRELAKMEMIMNQLSHSTLPSAREKEKEVAAEMAWIKEVLTCLPTDIR